MSGVDFVTLVGPTASGKSGLALELASYLPCEIVSVDSALVYRGMDIGTAKPTWAERQQCRHHLIDILDPAESYSTAEFVRDAEQAIHDIRARGRVPLLVGGTMMYLRSLLFGLAQLPSADPEVRQQICAMASEKGWGYVHACLRQVDPVSAARIHPNDPQRLQRALEVYQVSGKPLSEWQKGTQTPRWKAAQIGLVPEHRQALMPRIEGRFDVMLAQGFETEVRALKARSDLHLDLPSMRSVGYRQMWEYLDGKYTFTEMRTRAIIATGQLAKRQMTWLRKWPLDMRLDPLCTHKVADLAKWIERQI
ncbi:MAG: tRNA (adenosine(37)-N6)-dimethylallyltransferase MiaA [Gammaproteobacteria bacterium]|nr:MAG: tRNA (adenosine(37)-N6)-dimethylallyltransferase MiaA [Gammaproteobacteria bacterium]